MKQVALLGGHITDAKKAAPADELPPVAYAHQGAVLSPDGLYRYRLDRAWGPGPLAVFCMLNPTIKKCVGFARRWGCGSLTVVNLFAYRSTDPEGLDLALEDRRDITGPENDEHLRRAFAEAALGGRQVAAWGAHKTWGRSAEVLSWGGPFEALRITKRGAPEHPLYVPYDVQPVAFVGVLP